MRAAAAVTLVLAGTVAACGEAQLDTERAESAIRAGITRQTGVRIQSVRCPDDVKAERGGRFDCVAVAAGGQRARVQVLQRDDEGSVSWRLVRPR